MSFQAVNSGRPVHVPNVQKHGGVFFFCPEHKTEEVRGKGRDIERRGEVEDINSLKATAGQQ